MVTSWWLGGWECVVRGDGWDMEPGAGENKDTAK